jgi:hypothetical protein
MPQRKKVRERMFNKIRKIEQSGLPKSDFCARYEISQSNMHYWLKIYKPVTVVNESTPFFIPVLIDDIISASHNDFIIFTGQGCLKVFFLAKGTTTPVIHKLLEG